MDIKLQKKIRDLRKKRDALWKRKVSIENQIGKIMQREKNLTLKGGKK